MGKLQEMFDHRLPCFPRAESLSWSPTLKSQLQLETDKKKKQNLLFSSKYSKTSWNPIRLNDCKFISPLKLILENIKWWQKQRSFVLKLQNLLFLNLSL